MNNYVKNSLSCPFIWHKLKQKTKMKFKTVLQSSVYFMMYKLTLLWLPSWQWHVNTVLTTTLIKTSKERIDGVHPSRRNWIFQFKSFSCMKVLDTILLSESLSEQVTEKQCRCTNNQHWCDCQQDVDVGSLSSKNDTATKSNKKYSIQQERKASFI